MKNLISYVIQDNQGHKHHSEIINFDQLSYSSAPNMFEVMRWMDKRKSQLENDEKLILVNVIKV